MTTTRVPMDHQPYTMVDEQRATPRIERPPPLPPGIRDLWVLVGLAGAIVVLVFLVVLAFYL